MKYVYQHFDPASPRSPAIICKPGAYIGDIGQLLGFAPNGISPINLHIVTNDLATTDVFTAFDRYVALLDRIRHERPDITIIALPRWNVLVADGVHPSFTGAFLLAWNIYDLLLHLLRPYIVNCLDHALKPEAYELQWTPSCSQTRWRDLPGDTCRGGERNKKRTKQPHKQPLPILQARRSRREPRHGVRDHRHAYHSCRLHPQDSPRKR
ncbi:hypothetical protein HPB51_012914 [Rhipicephalus microplus]|uniref:Uncharacterized protein n=1 Tax=Rhipicephalus microplus TaxID=6941 RepID=A0A9J6ESY5_RHIMP|nr:hypothetical protein HPB51_012914 [Rhipicephalus microplus]